MVPYRDRLARFGVDLIERTSKKHGAALPVVSTEEDQPSDGDANYNELAEDLFVVCNFFVAKNNEPLPCIKVDNQNSIKLSTKMTTPLPVPLKAMKIKLHVRKGARSRNLTSPLWNSKVDI